MAAQYADLPTVSAEVALARGRIAESKGQAGPAADFYESIAARIDPDPAGVGVAGAVMELPLRIAPDDPEAGLGQCSLDPREDVAREPGCDVCSGSPS